MRRRISALFLRTVMALVLVVTGEAWPAPLRDVLAQTMPEAVLTAPAQAEQEATLFAAEFLMPSAEIKYQLQNATLQTLASLKPYWKVSMAALAMRARELGAITDRQHRRIFQQIGQLGYKTREPIEIPPEKPRLFQEILTVHQRELEYTLHDLEALLAEDLSSVVPTDKPRLTVVS